MSSNYNVKGTASFGQIIAAYQGLKRIVNETNHSIAKNQFINRDFNYKLHSNATAMAHSWMSMRDTGREIGDVWERNFRSLNKYFEATMRVSDAQQKFQAINLSGEDNQRAEGAVVNTVRQVRGSRLADTTEILTDLHTAVGHLDEA